MFLIWSCSRNICKMMLVNLVCTMTFGANVHIIQTSSLVFVGIWWFYNETVDHKRYQRRKHTTNLMPSSPWHHINKDRISQLNAWEYLVCAMIRWIRSRIIHNWAVHRTMKWLWTNARKHVLAKVSHICTILCRYIYFSVMSILP